MVVPIRPATRGEAPFLSDLALRSKAHWGYSREFIEACRDELTYSDEQIGNAASSFAVAEVAGAVAGFCILELLSDAEFELAALFVDPDWIGRGIGRALLDYARRTTAECGAHTLVVQADPHALDFYVAAGAVVTGERESGSIPGRYLPILCLRVNDTRWPRPSTRGHSNRPSRPR